jgi:hypothetical protein
MQYPQLLEHKMKEPTELVKILMERDGLPREEAEEFVEEAREAIRNGGDPEEILHQDFGLEPDYIFGLMEGL